MNRESSIKQVSSGTGPWDVVVIGGGATGLGTAVDAASRGYRTLLVERDDFGKGTSSRSTKLAHGGVRYLQQGNISLVLEALKERGRMLRNAPHLVRRQSFVIPAYSRWEIPFYGIGLKLYDSLSGRSSFGRSRMLGSSETRSMLSTLASRYVAGGVEYFDGQFDDARYCIALAQTLESLGGVSINYAPVVRFVKTKGIVSGVAIQDLESGGVLEVQSKVVVNATGVFTDHLRSVDEPNSQPLLTISQGSHLVLPISFLPGTSALMVPKTADGRVLFAIPWHNVVVVGTTDEGVQDASIEPRPMQSELTFLNRHVELYFGRSLEDADVLSMWSGLRPLVRKHGSHSTAAISREHSIFVSPSHVVSVAGGKWTTYRRMGEDTVNIAAKVAGLPQRPSNTHDLKLHGWIDAAADSAHALAVYGSDQPAIDALATATPELAAQLHPQLPYRMAEVVWAARHEMARTVEDVLARRTRALFLNARAAIEAAPMVAARLAAELGRDDQWQLSQVTAFRSIAAGYVYKR